MVNIKSVWVGLLTVLSAFLVSCSTGGTGIDLWNRILWLGSMEWLGYGMTSPVAGFLRILVFILVLTLFYYGAQMIGLPRNIGLIVSIILSLISTVFIPESILLAIGSSYGTIVAFALVGSVVFLGGWLLYITPATNTFWRVVRLLLIILLMIILWQIQVHAGNLAAVGPITVAGYS